MRWRDRALWLCSAGSVGVVGACATLDPAVPMRLPHHDVALGISGGAVYDERGDRASFGHLIGFDAGYLDDVWGVHVGLRTQHEGDAERLSFLVEGTVWFGALFGLGVRAGWLVTDSNPLFAVPRQAVDLTFLLAVPIPLGDHFVVAPYARPGFRLTGGDPDPDDLRGFHEFGLMLRWTSFGF